jgi:hypothetical protein
LAWITFSYSYGNKPWNQLADKMTLPRSRARLEGCLLTLPRRCGCSCNHQPSSYSRLLVPVPVLYTSIHSIH